MKLKRSKTLIAALALYLDDCAARGQSPRTVDGKRLSLERFHAWCLIEKIAKPQQLTELHLEAYRRYLYQYRQPVTEKPLDIATHRNHLTAVKTYLKRLYRLKVIAKNPAAELELPRVPRRLPKYILTVAEIERLLEQTMLCGLTGLRDRVILETYYATGVRRMELAKIRIQDIELDNRILMVHRGKGNKDRRIPIADRACQWIALYLKDIRPQLAHLESGQALFLANDGYAFKEYQLTYIASKYIKRAGIKKAGACNLFRHSTATLMHENGADLRHVQEMLGHADISTTQVYTHVTITKLREVYQNTHPAAQGQTQRDKH